MSNTRNRGRVLFWILDKSIYLFSFAIIVINLVDVARASDPVVPKALDTEVVTATNATMRACHCDPAELKTPGY